MMGTLQLQDLYIDDEDQAYFTPILRSSSTSNTHRIASSYDRFTGPARSSSLSKSYHAEEPTEEPLRRPTLFPSPGTIRKYNTWRTASEPGPYTLEGIQQNSQHQTLSATDKVQARVRRISTSQGQNEHPTSNYLYSNLYSPQYLTHSQPPQHVSSNVQITGQLQHQPEGQTPTPSMSMPLCTLRAKSPSDGLSRSKIRGNEYSTKARDRYEAPSMPLPSLSNQITEFTRRKRTQDSVFTEARLALPNASTYARAGVPQVSTANPHFAGWKPKNLRASTNTTGNRQQGLASLPVLAKMHQ